MDARTHAWIAVRAVGLLEETGDVPRLVGLLKPCAGEASVGAWTPDQTDAKRGDSGSKTENHVLKITRYNETIQCERFIMKKDRLLDLVGEHRMTARLLRDDGTLDDAWWASPYRGDVPRPGQHLPNRIMALSTMLKDLLLMGDADIDQLTGQSERYKEWMKPGTRTPDQAAAMYFFMLSHFATDVTMPCHCDARPLAAYDHGLHKELEAHWSRKVGPRFDRENIAGQPGGSDALLADARAVDAKFALAFATDPLPDLHAGCDEWLEAMYLCRASFAVASILADCRAYRYDDPEATAPFKTLFPNEQDARLAALDTAVLHDAVLNTAIFWKHVWMDIARN